MLRRLFVWRVPLALAALSFAAAAAERELLRYERAAIATGEAWRLVTGHFAHLGPRHLALNLAGLVLVWLLVGGTLSTYSWLLVIAITIAGIDAGFLALDERLAWYVGLSGLLHGMLAAGIVARVREAPGESAMLALALFAKLSWEQIAGPLPGSMESVEGPVVVNSHLYGALSGMAAALLLKLHRHMSPAAGADARGEGGG